MGMKSIWQAQAQCLFVNLATRNVCSLVSKWVNAVGTDQSKDRYSQQMTMHSTPCHPPLQPIITLGAEEVQVTGPGRLTGMI
jgi:hypothetical protein